MTVRLLTSIKLFISGPVWALGSAVSILSGVIGVVLFLQSGSPAQLWMFLFFGAAALVVAAFWTFHESQAQDEQREGELPQAVERLIKEGMDLQDKMTATQEATPERIGPWGEQIDEAFDFFERARQLLIDAGRPSLMHDLANGFNAARHKTREEEEKASQAITRREKEGEEVGNAEKMELWAKSYKNRSTKLMEANLVGLVEVRRQLPA